MAQAEHFVPRAASGRTTNKNINYSCHVCNRLKHDYVFDTVSDLIDFLDREWARHG
jgi:5-methylcytosine-specific restriction endonuclease McrA